MIDVGDLREFAYKFGKWLHGINPDLDEDKLKTVAQQFAKTAPIGVGEASALSVDEFCEEAAYGYTSEEEASSF